MGSLPASGCALLWLAAIVLVARRIRQVNMAGWKKWIPTIVIYFALLALLYVMENPVAFCVLAAIPPGAVLYAAFFIWIGSRDVGWIHAALDAGEIDKALAGIDALIARKGPRANRLNLKGLVHQALEDWTEAADAFAAAERLARSHELPAKAPDDTYDEAVSAFDEVAPLQGDAAIFRANRALAMWKAGRPEEALPLMEQARRDLPTTTVIASNLAQLYLDLGRPDEAREQIEAAQKLHEKHPLAPEQQARMAAELERCRRIFAVHRDEEAP